MFNTSPRLENHMTPFLRRLLATFAAADLTRIGLPMESRSQETAFGFYLALTAAGVHSPRVRRTLVWATYGCDPTPYES
jgi:hypothetical protein